MSQPSTNGRNTNGQFTQGNKYGKGNPYARHVARLRTSLIEAVGDDGLADIVQGMVTAAKGASNLCKLLFVSYFKVAY